MKIESIKWRNFTSWGNAWHELHFDGDSSLSLICGENGAGKTSISNLVTYMLYGQLDDFTLKEIPNRINRNMEGYITVSSRGRKVVVHRGLNPQSFDVEVDGKPVETAGKANIQAYLENEIIGVPYSLFKNSIALSVDDFKSFIKMSPNDKREIIDRLFGYGEINEISRRVKDKIKEIRREADDLSSRIDGYNDSIETVNGKIERIRESEKGSGERAKARAEAEAGMNACNEALGKINEKAAAIESRMRETSARENEARKAYSDAGYELMGIRKKLELYSNSRCPTCGARLDDDEHEKMKRDLLEAEKAALAKHEACAAEMNSIGVSLSELDGKMRLAKNKADAARIRIAELRKTAEAADENYRKRIGEMEALIAEIEAKIEPAEKRLGVCRRNLGLLDVVLGVFSESGLKKHISGMYLPVINGYVEELRETLGIGYRIVFDANYDCRVYEFGEEIRYRTMSKGERKKADIAVTLAFLKILKTKVNDINMLFLDEVLSGIDVESCNKLLVIFKKFARDLGLNVFIVHHANLESSIVDSVMEIRKQNGFSHFADE